MTESVKNVKQVCKCENCGNEAEMVVTCTLPESESKSAVTEAEKDTGKEEHMHRVKGTATCSHCGNEADMWVDI
jgi:hypothetical protein